MNKKEKGMIIGLFVVAGLIGLWNAWTATLLTDYDAIGHLRYIYEIHNGTWPEPLSGWSTFHPPLYYFICAPLWHFEIFGERVLNGIIRSLSVLFYLTTGLLVFLTLQRLNTPFKVTLGSVALVLFLPSHMLAGSMLGNEALGITLCTLTLYLFTSLLKQEKLHLIVLVGVTLGLALCTKFSALYMLLGLGLFTLFKFSKERMAYCTIIFCLTFVVSLPVYLRNFSLTGTLFPMTRTGQLVAEVENRTTIRERRLRDYIPEIPPLNDCEIIVNGELNRRYQNVWTMAYISSVYDPFAVKIPWGSTWPKAIVVLGLAPLCILFGGIWNSLCRRNNYDVLMLSVAFVTLGLFCTFTFGAPALVAAKGSYLLPAVLPMAYFVSRSNSRALPTLWLFIFFASVIFTNWLV